MKIITRNGVTAAAVDGSIKIRNSQEMLDLIASVSYEYGCDIVIIRKESLDEDFFDLKTRLAGEILQKISNYEFRLAVIGDFSVYDSKNLRDFIYESNRAGRVLFMSEAEEALRAWNF